MCRATKNILATTGICLLSVGAICAQPPGSESGTPFIQHYVSEDYHAHVQNWASVQDRNGIMYFGNSEGVLEYDGVSWKLITTQKSTHVRSLDIDKHGKIFVGAYGEIGFIGYDSIGQSCFKPITQQLDTAYHDFLDVWKTFCKDDGVYFSSYKYLFRWSPSRSDPSEGSFKVWQASSHFQFAFSIGEKLFIQQRRIGLMELVDDSLKLIPGGDVFKDSWVFAMMAGRNNKALIVDRTHGLYTFDGEALIKLEASAEKRILDSKVFQGIALPDGNFALATNLDGILIINDKGTLVKSINTSNGLQNASATSLYLDQQNGLWATLSNGIDRIELNTPFSLFENVSSESNAIQSIIRHKGKIYFASGVGVHVLRGPPQDDTSGPISYWEKIEGITTQCWSFASVDNKLLIGTSNGLFYIDENDEIKVISTGHVRSLYKSRTDSTRVFVGKERRLEMLSFHDGTIKQKQIGSGINDEIFFIDEDSLGYLWCSTVYNGIHRFRVDSSGNVLFSEHLTLEHGLPTLKNNTARMVNGRLLISTQRGIYIFDDKSNRFKPDSTMAVFSGAEIVHLLADHEGTVWAHGNFNGDRIVGYGKQNADTLTWTMNPFNRFLKYPVYTIYPDHDGIVWFGGPNGAVRYDPKIKKEYNDRYQAIVRKVLVDQDSLVYGGFTQADFSLEIDFDYNVVRFEFSASSYDDEATNQYSYFLEGFDKGWSGWTLETRKDYTNLPDNNYKLRVKAKNIYNSISEEGTFTFSILPAWYDTWWAYVLYTFAFGTVITALVQFRFRQIRKEKENLEETVAERTKEVAFQADQLREQAEKLKELDHTKSRFFANISHEFRTPLTLISGCVEDLIADSDEQQDQVRLAVMQKNTKRLRQLIEQLLDLSKLESGKLSVKVAPINPNNFLRAIASSFSSWAVQKKITLSIDLSGEEGLIYFDQDVLDKIINNLLSNALKFTPSFGEVSLSAQWTTEMLSMEVSDNGIGIPPSKLNKIFNRFYQVDDTSTRTQEGSGIGLALVKELVALHHGNIAVKSEEGVRTVFSITIPVDKKYYLQDEIVSDHEAIIQKEFNKENLNIAGESDYEFQVRTDENLLVLVVEDNVDLARYIAAHLPDYEVILAENGTEGFDKATRSVPDLIISDVMMPEMDGVELCKKIKEEEKTSHIPIILLTAKADIESRLEGLETGADDYITKPFDTRELQTRVKNLIQQREKLRTHFSRTVVLKPKDIAITPSDETFLSKVMTIVENHLSESEFSIEDFQKEIGMSRMQLHRKLKAMTGHSAGEFLRIQRLIRASQLLTGIDNVTEVCYQTGFTSPSYFAKCFKRQFGASPKDYASLHSQTHR